MSSINDLLNRKIERALSRIKITPDKIVGQIAGSNLPPASETPYAPNTPTTKPAFFAHSSSSQSIPAAQFTKVEFATELFDLTNDFLSSRFTPSVEGYYQIGAQITLGDVASGKSVFLMLYKNGTRFLDGPVVRASSLSHPYYGQAINALLYADGNTDYFEIYVYQSDAVARTIRDNSFQCSTPSRNG